MSMYSELTTENFNKIKQAIQEKEKKILDQYPYLSQDKIMSQEEHEKEAVKVMKRIKDQLSDVKLHETSSQENIQEGLRFINLANEIYILGCKEKKILQEKNQSIQQLLQAEEQVQHATKQLQQAEEQLEQTKKQLESMQEKHKLIKEQKTMFINALQKGMIFINLANEIYILGQQEKKILQEEDQSIQELQQEEKQVLQAKEQLHQAEEQLEQAMKQLNPMQEKLRLINEQKLMFINALQNNKMIVVQKLTTE